MRIFDAAEAHRCVHLLRRSCELLVSDAWRAAHPERLRGLRSLSYREAEGPGPDDPQAAADLLARIPLDLPGLLASPLAVRDDDPLPPPIERAFAHKRHAENVLLSEPYRLGGLWHFNLLPSTAELRFDHPSEHVQGLLLLEAMRQASLAGAHLVGLPPSTGMSLLSYDTHFSHYLSAQAPVILRIYPFFADARERADKPGFVVNQVFQWGTLCASAVTSAYLFTDPQNWERHQGLAQRLMARSAKGFARRMAALAGDGGLA